MRKRIRGPETPVLQNSPDGIRAIKLRMTDSALDRFFAGGWRGPLFAALVALAAGLPGLLAMPVLDRDEARFAEASAQMLETRDFVSVKFQDEPRNKKPVGIHWLQAAAVGAFSGVEQRRIWAYRLPSLFGAMAAAAACAWGAAALLGPRGGAIAGAILGASLVLSTEAFIAKTDAALCGCTTLMMAALGRIYASSRGEAVAGVGTRAVFWLGLALSILIKGPVGPMVAALAIVALWIWDRRVTWISSLGWTWGLVGVLFVVGPWALAVTVATDGAFWSGAVMGDMVSKLQHGQESHGAPPGLHLLLSPLLLFPATALLPAALAHGWKERSGTLARFAICWLVPSWIVFEIAPTKLPHYTLPLYGALAWMAAAALTRPIGRVSRYAGVLLSCLVGVALAAAGVVLAKLYGTDQSLRWSIAAAVLALAAAGAGSVGVLSDRRAVSALLAALGAGLLAHDALAAGLAPGLQPLWVSRRAAAELRHAGIDPRNGVTPGPVAVAGYEEPSIVFLLGAHTQLGDGQTAAEAISEGRPAIVESHELHAFMAELKAEDANAEAVAEVKGLDYSKGKPVDLFLYGSLESARDEAGDEPEDQPGGLQ
jgi:4-amino-4-deoxy-L-arabinose transferase-like glycosyltransferase